MERKTTKSQVGAKREYSTIPVSDIHLLERQSA